MKSRCYGTCHFGFGRRKNSEGIKIPIVIIEDEREGPDHRCGPKVVRGPMDLCGPQMPSRIFIYITTVVTSFVKQNSLFLLFSKIL